MDPQTTETTEAQQRLAAALTAPPAPPQTLPAVSQPSEVESLLSLMGTLVTRVDQLAKIQQEQFAQQERVNAETVATMELAREMIIQMDRQYTEMTDITQRMETVATALVRVNANLTEIVAALVAPTQQKG